MKKQRLQRSAGSAAEMRKERLETDVRKLVLKPLSKCSKGKEGELQAKLEAAGLTGIQSVSVTSDWDPNNDESGVVGFVVFASVEEKGAACGADNRASVALLGTN